MAHDAKAVLERVEWGHGRWGDGCVLCGNLRTEGHAPDCDVGAVLGYEPKLLPGECAPYDVPNKPANYDIPEWLRPRERTSLPRMPSLFEMIERGFIP